MPFVAIRVCLTGLLAMVSSAVAMAADVDWKTVAVPQAWKASPGGTDTRLWYRAAVRIPQDWQGREVSLAIESVDDAREIYFAGQKIGTLGQFPPNFLSGIGETKRLKIPAEKLRPGEVHQLAIRVCVVDGRSGFNVAAPVLFAGDQAVRMLGNWQTRSGDDLAWASATAAELASIPTFEKVEPADVVERELKKLQDEVGPLSPEQTLAHLKVPDDLKIELAISEPAVRQPLSIKWDARGRLWCVQYLQYPHPAGLTAISRDKFLRTVYDKVPPAPPHHFLGEDKITIHEDTNGDGKYDQHKTFVDGLSVCSSFAFGNGGVWVLNPPYLLFYPDKNGDDIPDGDPEVHLEGFGIEDSHSVANNLRWGPDGWLYGAQGSTVTGDIRRPGEKKAVHSLGQLIWRYHPPTKKYEIFAEGGGNAFGVEFDDEGRVFSGHNGGNTRGFHYVQGGYFQKGFGKHGELSNPFTFGYFEAMAHAKVPRFTHAFVIYGSHALPAKYRGQLMGVAPLQSHVTLSDLKADKSSFKTEDVGHLFTSSDPWVRPIDIQVGPDGAVYVVDMYEQRIDHASHYQGRVHKESGRIWRIVDKEAGATKLSDLSQNSADDLIATISSNLDDRWQRQTALQLLAQVSIPPKHRELLVTKLEQQLADAKGQQALELLWAVNALAGFNNRQTADCLKHSTPAVREWAVRLACDDDEVSSSLARDLATLASQETDARVRSQLASSARRLPAEPALAIVKALATTNDDAADIHLPLLMWWAIEAKAATDRDAVVELFADRQFCATPLAKSHLLERVARRYAATGQRKDLLTVAQLLKAAPSKEDAGKMMVGIEAAFQGRAMNQLPAELVTAMAAAGNASPTLRLRQGESAAVAAAIKEIGDDSVDASKRQQLVAIFGTINQPSCVPALLKLVKDSRNDGLRSVALGSLQSYADPTIGEQVVAAYRDLPEEVRAVAQSLLASRSAWAKSLIDAIDAGQIEPASIHESTVRRLLLSDSQAIRASCKKHWGELAGTSSEALRAQVEQLLGVAAGGSGNPYQGKKIYMQSCGKCHKLFTDGGQIGPDLTTYKRDDLRGILLNVVNPSAEIREGFENYLVQTADGRTLSGFIAEQDAQVLVLRGVDGQSLSLPRDEIEDLRAVPISLMPEGLLKKLSEQQIRDLLAYIRSTQPLP
ncbi:Cytochrome c [Anatilimnocola aggregata]|uniref:Cytochrome c n=1 Tax=Anatilimnocola aggregata TaxID=2528021 RepID=A0A517YIM5_9BACT|nr:PVC-type heme-binding CxxCH protein [Anatilimnocola aggregata]QDU30078.1 Cytochrome c [Anatilimnocola aggregata]